MARGGNGKKRELWPEEQNYMVMPLMDEVQVKVKKDS